MLRQQLYSYSSADFIGHEGARAPTFKNGRARMGTVS